jgi:hypothetical protein
VSLTANTQVVISNSTITNNRAEGSNSAASGGGLLISGNSQPFQIIHSTIAFNFAGFTGGGIQGDSGGSLQNTIVAHNDAAAFPSPFGDQCFTQFTNLGGVMEFPANGPNPCVSGVTVDDPELTALAPNGGPTRTHMLQASSPAIDVGACTFPTDQRGIPRPQGPACDLGAVEVLVPSPDSDFFTVSPCRLVDTRPGAPLACNADHTFVLTGSCGVPSGAKAVSANVAVDQPSSAGNLKVFPAGVIAPVASVLNYQTGSIVGNNAILRLNASGQVAVRCGPSGSSDVIIDVNGYFQ